MITIYFTVLIQIILRRILSYFKQTFYQTFKKSNREYIQFSIYDLDKVITILFEIVLYVPNCGSGIHSVLLFVKNNIERDKFNSK